MDNFVDCETIKYLCNRFEQDLSLYRGHKDSMGRPYGDPPDQLLEQLIDKLREECTEKEEDEKP